MLSAEKFSSNYTADVSNRIGIVTDTKDLVPFVGLRPFDVTDHRWFYGRDHEIATLLRKVRGNRFTSVVGASGSGKSSLVRAGILLPLFVENSWEVIIVKPGSAPIAKLAAALSVAAHRSAVDDSLAASSADPFSDARTYRYNAILCQSAFGLSEISHQLVPDASRLLLVVDQFEELFRYGEEAQGAEKAAMEEESRAFVELLLTASSQSTGRLHIVLTMRSDFFGNCAAYAGLAEAVSASQYLVPLPRRDQMETIIRQPIADAGGKVDEMLVQRLLLEVAEQTDHLPALQHTLRRLWEMAQNMSGTRWLRERDYQTIGGITGSIDFKAEQIATELKKVHAEDFITLERVMKAITDLDEQGRATRRPQKKSALLKLVAEVMGDKQAAEVSLNRVLTALANEEISFIQLSSGDDPEVDIGHEALIRSWRRLCGEDRQFKTGWLVDEREDGRHWWDLVRRKRNKKNLRLTDAWLTRDWIKNKKIGPVWTNRYGDMWETIHQFIRSSLLKNGAIALLILSAITVVLVTSIGFAWMSYEQRVQQEDETLRQARAGALAAAGYARRSANDGHTRFGALIALRVMPESRRADDPRYVEEVGAALANGLTRPVEIMRLNHSEFVTSVAFSPDGRRIVSSSSDNTLRIWDAQTGAPIGEPLTGHENSVLSVAFSPDGSRIVSGSVGNTRYGNTLRIWDAETGAPIGELLTDHTYAVFSVMFSSDGSRIVSSSYNMLFVWDVQTGTLIGEPLTGHLLDVTSVVFSPDGSRIVSGSMDHTLRIWDAQTGAPIGEPLTGHKNSVLSVAYSPDGRYIVSGSGDKTLRIWGAQTGAPIGEPLTGHQSDATSVAYSPDGRQIISGSKDKTLRIWDAQSGAPIGGPLTGHQSDVTSVAYSPDGYRIISGSVDNTLRVWDVQSGAPIGEPLTDHKKHIRFVAYSPDSSRIVLDSGDNTLRIWDAQTGAPIGEPLTGHKNSVLSVAYSPDGRYIVSGSGDKTLRIWDAQTGAPIGEPLTGHEHSIWSVTYSPDGRHIVSGSQDNTLRIWDAQTGAPLGEPLTGHQSDVMSVAYSPDGRRIVSGSWDNTLRIWDAQTGVSIGESLTGHEKKVTSVVFSPDGRRIVSGSWDNTLRVWDAKTGVPIGEPLTDHENGVLSVAYSPDGRRIVSGSLDNTLRVWDAQTGAPLGEPLTGHGDAVTSVAYSPDGSRIVSGSSDGTLRQWNAGLFSASLKELVAKAEKLCPLNLEERQRLRLIDPLVEAVQKPLTPDQRRACGE